MPYTISLQENENQNHTPTTGRVLMINMIISVRKGVQWCSHFGKQFSRLSICQIYSYQMTQQFQHMHAHNKIKNIYIHIKPVHECS